MTSFSKKENRVVAVGDTLIVAVAKENHEWGYNPAADGTRLKVTGFNTHYRGRVGEFGRKPGKYSFNDNPIVIREDNGDAVSIGRWHMHFEDGSDIPMDLDGTWIDDLPALPFWEGDTVSTLEDTFGRGTKNVVVTRIDYYRIGEFCTDGVTPYPIYTISPSMGAGISTSSRNSDLHLVARGNVWKYYHEEPLIFEDIASEAQFYDGQLGRTKDVRNEICGLFSWTIEEAVNAVREGKGDSISVSASLFGSKQRPYVKKFLDVEVGDRVRKATLEGWSDFDPKKFSVEIEEELKHRKEMEELFHRGREK